MRKNYSVFCILILIILFSSARIFSQARYFNKFQYYVTDKKILDSAYYNAEELAKRNIKLFRSLIHENFIQHFIAESSSGKNNYEKELLSMMMKSPFKQMADALLPLSYLSSAGDAIGKPEKMKLIAGEFIEKALKASKGADDRVERYALLIHSIAAKEKGCGAEADSIIFSTMHNLEKYLATKLKDGDRAWCRYLYAYCNYLLAEKAIINGDNNSAAKYYKSASHFSPDARDKNSSDYYYYDIAFLFKENGIENFKDKYVSFLKDSDKTETLRVLTEKAIEMPESIKDLRKYYDEKIGGEEGFIKYWEREFNNALGEAPLFSIKNKDGKEFNLIDYMGKWIFIDFWGTWCSPCIEEYPELQRFFMEMSTEYPDRLKIITVANRTTFEDASDFMKKNNYTTPFYIADGIPERLYNVESFPTKVLITPRGKYIKIPYGKGWADKVKYYMGIL